LRHKLNKGITIKNKWNYEKWNYGNYATGESGGGSICRKMSLQLKQIIAYGQLLSGNQVLAMGRYALQNNIRLLTAKDMLDYIRLCIDQKVIRYEERMNWDAIGKSLYDANRIIDKSRKTGVKIVSCFDELFPAQLKRIQQEGNDASPLVLYCKGNIQMVGNTPGIALIGTRHPTREGVRMGEYFGYHFASKGYNIVSGLALGCDAAAHRGALAAKGLTTAFVGHGLDIVYPKKHEALAERILYSGGAILSEYPPGTPCSYKTLIARCRLQAGLADTTVVIQTDDKKGGSMHAVRTAKENNKTVYAVEYEDAALSNHPMVEGNSQLIAKGWAKPLRQEFPIL
jgi:DNA processing protein